VSFQALWPATERRLLGGRTVKGIGLTHADINGEHDRLSWEPVDHGALDLSRRRSGPRLDW